MAELTVKEVDLTGRINHFKGADIASAATTNINTATGNFVNITGTTTITSLGTATQAGIIRIVEFTGALTLTHNATLIDLPGDANIVTATGDTAIFVSNTTAIWKCISYIPTSSVPLKVQSAYTQTYSTAEKTHENMTSAAMPAGGTGSAAGGWDTAINRNQAIAAFAALRTDVIDLKQLVNSIIDDLQALKLVG